MSSVEQLQSLPIYMGDLCRWERDVSLLKAALEHPNGYSFEAQLPQVIGTLSLKDQAYLETAEDIEGDYYPNGDLNKLLARLPDLSQTVADDILAINGGSTKLDRVDIDRRVLRAGIAPRAPGWHTDMVIHHPSQTVQPTYVVATTCPTDFYQGPARFYMGGNFLNIDDDRLEVNAQNVVKASPNDIVRLSGATVHRSPLPAQDGEARTFIRFSTRS